MSRSLFGYVSVPDTEVVAQSETTYAVCSGGTETSITSGNATYTLHTFTGDGTLTVTTPGFVDVVVVGGGGGAGAVETGAGGGGGGGAVIQQTVYLNANQSITVGSGEIGRAHV